MTARDARLEAVCEVLRARGWIDPDFHATEFLAMYDAVRAFEVKRFLGAFDEQRKPVPLQDYPKIDVQSLVESLGGASGRGRRAANPIGLAPVGESPAPCGPKDNVTAPAASPVGADPPWLGDAAKVAFDTWAKSDWPDVVRAVLSFAAAQPPSEAEIEAAAEELYNEPLPPASIGIDWLEASLELKQHRRNQARLMLLAAAKVKAGG